MSNPPNAIEAAKLDFHTAVLKNYDQHGAIRFSIMELVALFDETCRRHFTTAPAEQMTGPVKVKGYPTNFYIVRDVMGGHQYLRKDGKWYDSTGGWGLNGDAYWPTREAAEQFLRELPAHLHATADKDSNR